MAKRKADEPLSWTERLILKLIIKRLIKYINNMKGSWKTSLMGTIKLIVLAALAVILMLDGDPTTVPNMNDIYAVLAIAGFTIPDWLQSFFTRDKDVSTEEQKIASAK